MPAPLPRILALLLVPLGTLPILAQLPKVQEHRFPNGLHLLLVERPGAGSLHARLLVRGGRADTGTLPSGAAELLARSLFGHALPAGNGAGAEVEALLKQEEGAFESLRLERARRQRVHSETSSPEEAALVQLHAQRLAELKARLRELDAKDPLDGLGATRRQASARADSLNHDLDLPSRSFEAWCQLEAQRLRQLSLAAFPAEREALLQEPVPKASQALSVLLGTAFSGHPYGQTLELQRGSLEAISENELRDLARDLIRPDRITLVLVGDLGLDDAMKSLRGTLGALAPAPEGRGRREERVVDLPEAPGFRRLQASTSGDPRIFFAWRMPPATHPDEPALRVLAAALGGSKGSRLVRRVQEEHGLARSLSVRTGVPGSRDSSLFLIEAEPAEGHGLAELEEAIHGEVLRIQRELFPEEDLRHAQRQLEAEALMAQEDAGALARLLGDSVVQSGDWRQAFRMKALGRDLTPQEMQAVARRYLVPEQGITALLDADPLLSPRDPVEERLGKALNTLVQRKIEDPAQVEAVVRETLRQLRMLSSQERDQTLKLLELQAAR